jgi:hypothetical protein
LSSQQSHLVDGPLPYPFVKRPFRHQFDCWIRQKDEVAAALFMDVGTGKSKSVIDQIAYNYDLGRINGLVIVAGKGNYQDWPDSHLPTHLPTHIRHKIGVWVPTPNKAQRAAMDALFTRSDDSLHIFVMNIEALATDRGKELLKTFLLSHSAAFVIDESTSIKNPQSLRTKAAIKLGGLAKMRRILCGYPDPNGPLDLYSQFEFLDSEFLGYGSFWAYKAHFAICKTITVTRNDKFGRPKQADVQVVTGYRNAEALNKLISRHSFIVKKEDCLDLPPKTYLTRYVEMAPKQGIAYAQMKKLCLAELEAGQGLMTAGLVITQLLRLHQILCGFAVSDETKQAVAFNESNPRLEALMQDVSECSGKVLIWATYKHSVAMIRDRLAKDYGPQTVRTYYGPDSVDARREAISHFDLSQTRYDPNSPVRFLVANKTGARGLTLTAANTALYYSNDYDSDTRQQNEARPDRIGQLWPVTYIDYTVRDTEDEKITKALIAKVALSDIVTASNWRTLFK